MESKIIELNNQKYEIIENDRNCFNLEEIKMKITEYFDSFDYIFGDYAYGKLRLKGFNDSNNKNTTKINNINILSDYKSNYCSYGARTFLLKKVK